MTLIQPDQSVRTKKFSSNRDKHLQKECLETGSDEDAMSRRFSSWFQWLEICMFFASVTRMIPFSLSFDSATRRYVVKSSSLQKITWLAFRIGAAFIFWTEFANLIRTIRSSHDDYLYFDLLFVMGWLMFDYPIMYIWRCRTERVQEFFDELQDLPILLKVSPKKSKAVQLFYAIAVAWYLSTTFAFFPTQWGMFEWTLTNYYKTLQLACELYFRISKGSEDEFWYPGMILITFLLTSFQYAACLCGDILSVSAVVTMKRIAVGIDKAIQSGALSDEEVYSLIKAHKRLTWKFNRAFGLLVSVYVVYSSPYYSLHFVDMVQIPGLMNRLSMLTYAVCFCLSSKWAVDILILAKRRKRWLSRQNRVLSLDRATCNVMLDDITWEKYGLGSYYTVNSYATGQILSLILTVAVVRIQSLASKANAI